MSMRVATMDRAQVEWRASQRASVAAPVEQQATLGDAVAAAQRRLEHFERSVGALGWAGGLLSVLAAGTLTLGAPLSALGFSILSLLVLGVYYALWTYTAGERVRYERLGERWLRRLQMETDDSTAATELPQAA